MSEQTRDLLIELGTEELPPKALRKLRDAFAEEIERGLEEAGLQRGALKRYASPRRLAVVIERLAVRQADRAIERKGPAVAVAFKDGAPTKAAEGFARSCGTTVDQLEQLESEQGSWLVYRAQQAGAATETLVPEIVDQALKRLPIPKRMRWGAGKAAFVRPVHWLVLLFGTEVIPARLLGVESDRITRGHRFHAPEPISLQQADEYATRLEKEGRVIAELDRRREMIRGQVEQTAREAGAEPIIEKALLEEVAGLVEWPVPVLGRFDQAFLEVPPEALISSMQEHQKYFPLRDEAGRLCASFITIANIASHKPEAVRSGNERVIRPRLADAAFFWRQDRRQPLAARTAALQNVVYQAKLGTVYAKSGRVAALARGLGQRLGVSPEQAERAAWLAKCDLATEMVGEFPDLQGTMGRYYAAHDGEAAEVAAALEEQYLPRHAGETIAPSALGRVLAIAERADTLMGIFAIGRAPTGDKDPFALRRAGLSLLRTIIEGELDVDLRALLEDAAKQLPAKLGAEEQVAKVFGFCMERLRAYYLEAGVASELFEAVAACEPTQPLDFDRRLRACQEFLALPEAASLAAANKRIRNILRKNEQPLPEQVKPELLSEQGERALMTALESARAAVLPLLEQRRYTEALAQLAGLREPVDAFFDQVMVMAEDEAVRGNRLKLLREISALFLEIADVSRLPG